MEWEFSAEDIVKARVDYRLENFRQDLYREVSMNLPQDMDEQKRMQAYNVVYDLHYWLATGRPFGEYEQQFASNQFLGDVVRLVHAHSAVNVEMLGAILQRSIMDGVESGMPLEQAVEAAAGAHCETLKAPLH